MDSVVLRDVRDSLMGIGYQEQLIKESYSYAAFGPSTRACTASLAAFAQAPPSAFTACIGLATSREELQNLRYLGAPLIVEVAGNTGRRWQSTRSDLIELDNVYKPLSHLFRAHGEEWRPERIFRAKSVGAFEKSAQLDFVDIGLLPAIEAEARQKLDALIRGVVDGATQAYASTHEGKPPPENLLFRLLFKLITAKVLRDTNVMPDLDFAHPWSVLHAVQGYSQSDPLTGLDEAMLTEASLRIAASFPFSNISADTLAFVYENTLVSEATRRELSVHPTPSYVAEYILNRLPLADKSLDSIRVVDPMCGHGSFLVAALRKLRTFLPTEWSPEDRHAYFLERIVGQDIDPFSVEVARLSLTLADLPHPNGWRVQQGDTYRKGALERIACDATVFVTNPPFEAYTKEEIGANPHIQTTKAAEMLVRTLRALPNDALVGVVMPLSFMTGRSYRQARDLLERGYRIHELLTLPDNVFGRSDTESTLLLAQKCSGGAETASYNVSYRGVRKDALAGFARDGSVSRDDLVSTSELFDPDRSTAPGFWVPSHYSAWSALSHRPKLGGIAEIHRGVEYGSKLLKEHRSLIVRGERFPFSALGIDSVDDQLRPFLTSGVHWISTEQEHRRGGAWNLSWAEPKVFVNAVRRSRGPWRMIAAGDTTGLLGTQVVYAIWPEDPAMLPFVAALLNSAIANAFMVDHEGGRHNHGQTIKALPLPEHGHPVMTTVTRLAEECHRRVTDDPSADLTSLLLEIDAQLLTAYDLCPRDERRLLDLFSGTQRPGCPSFTGFFPSDYAPTIPLHVYLSREYREASAQGLHSRVPALNDQDVSDMLTELREVG